MRAAVDGWLERDGVDLHFLEWKAAASVEPPLLLLHGLSSNARYWERVARHLPDRRIVALDQRAHGLTGAAPHRPRFPDGYSMPELVGDARHVAAELGLSQPVLAGHSWGAAVALEAAASEPAFASAVVFIDGPLQNLDRVLSWEEAEMMMQPPLPRYSSLEDAISDSRRDFDGAWGDDLEDFVKARVMADGDALVLTLTAPARLELLRGMYRSNPERLWPRLNVPATVLVAQRTFARMRQAVEEGIERLQASAPAVVVKRMDSPHDIPLFLPAAVAAELAAVTTAAGAAG